MGNTVIKVENLSKKYIISHQQPENYSALRDVMAIGARRLGKTIISLLTRQGLPYTETEEEYFALKDVSFEINQGDRVGIIGRNGAGKSTLLKVLSRITEPTSGRIEIIGRVASLLEVGTGFHPELTGRENIFLNGAILGMKKEEIKRKFDEIVAFAEVERFLDTPVKRYSSGMYVRLAFAVAAHLEPDILMVDEVLAVGDAQFQKKCMDKMEEVGREGRTVLFVSHNLASISNLCEHGIYLKDGIVSSTGIVANVLQAYLHDMKKNQDVPLSERKDRTGNGTAQFTSVELLDAMHHSAGSVMCGQDLNIRIKFSSKHKKVVLKNILLGIGIDDSKGQRVWHLSNDTIGKALSEINVTTDYICITIPRLPLVSGRYAMVLFLAAEGGVVDWIQNAKVFDVEPGDFFKTGKLPPHGQGCFLADYSIDVVAGDA